MAESFSVRFWERIGLQTKFRRLLVLVLFGAIAYFFTLSNVFLVKKAAVRSPGLSAEQVSEVLKKLGQTRTFLVPRNHILLLNEKSLLQALQSDFPEVRRVTGFRRIFPDKIEVAVEERQPRYVWQSGENYYFLDQDGIVFEKLPADQLAEVSQVLIADRTAASVKVGQDLGIGKSLAVIQELKILWPKFVTQTDYVIFSLPGTLSPDILVKTRIGFEVYFDLNRRVKTQLNGLKLLLSQEIKPETYGGLSYIDLRLPTVAYYCYRDAPCALENATSTPKVVK